MGVRLSDATTKPCKVQALGPKVFRIILTQGLNRQIRRMCEAFGYTVEALQRVRIMHVKLGELPLGRWRNLTEQEVSALLPRGERPQQPSRPPQQHQQARPHGRPPQRHPGQRPGSRRGRG